MTSPMTASHEANRLNLQTTDHNYRFFDPKPPEQPDQVFGVNTEAILELGRATTALGVLPPSVNLGLYALPDAVRLIPLVEEMQAGATLTPEDVRPYRKPIKKLSLEVSFADKLAAGAGAVAVGIPIRRALNRKIEREFPARAASAIDQAREAVAAIEHDVNYISGFDNPQEQFVTELNGLAQMVSTAIVEQRDRRVRNNGQTEVEPETPRGVLGFFTKAVRKLRGLFGIFKNKPKVNREVTAYDAGAGIANTIRSISRYKSVAENQFPMLSRLLLQRLPDNLLVSKDRLALAAPEILNFLFSTSAEDGKSQGLLASVKRNPHELRFMTKFKKHYGRYSLEGIQQASFTLMPAIRDVLPTEGAKVREIFTQAQALLQPRPAVFQPEAIPEQAETKRKGLRTRLKSLFRRRS